jgi:hypothetical protein
MTPEERDIIVNFIARVSGAQAAGGSFASVPSTVPALPPVDREADALIADQFNRYPEARYRLTQLAFVQEHALAEAQNRLKRMEWELQQAQQQAQQAQQAAQQAAAQPQQSRGFLGGLFGGASAPPPQQPPQGVWGQTGGGAPGGSQAPPNWQQQPPAPPPQYAPGYQQGMFQRQGSGFLGSALTTAAGVAGGVVAGNVLMDMFSSRREGGGLFGGGASPVEGAAASPWATGGALPEPPVPADPGYVDQGSWSTPDPAAPSADNAWAQPDQSGWTDNTDTSGGGSDWATDNSGGSDDDNFS